MPKFKHMLISSAALLFTLIVIAPLSAHAQTNRQPYQETFTFNVAEGYSSRIFHTMLGLDGDTFNFTDAQCRCTYSFDHIPTLKRLVIEHVSATAKVPQGQMIEIGLRTSVRSATPNGMLRLSTDTHSFVPTNKVSGAKDWYVLSQVTRLYHTWEALSILATRSGTTGVAEVKVVISGYYEDESFGGEMSGTTPQ